jgi:hypothetical protein
MRLHLIVAVSLSLTSSLASAGSSNAPAQAATTATATPTAASLVTTKLIQPLAARDNQRSRFSRARLPPAERRVRVLDESPQHDSSGNAFYTFAIDQRHGWREDDASWSKAAMTGCVYPGSSEVFIKRGNAFHPASAAVGKKTKAAPERTCQAAAQLSKS